MPALPTILEEDEEEPESSHDLGVLRQKDQRPAGRKSTDSKARLAEIEEDDEDMMDWDEETTLVALLQDRYAIQTLR